MRREGWYRAELLEPPPKKTPPTVCVVVDRDHQFLGVVKPSSDFCQHIKSKIEGDLVSILLDGKFNEDLTTSDATLYVEFIEPETAVLRLIGDDELDLAEDFCRIPKGGRAAMLKRAIERHEAAPPAIYHVTPTNGRVVFDDENYGAVVIGKGKGEERR